MPDAAIECHDLAKSFGNDSQALRGVSFAVARASVCALLGHNGAGKTTTINILSTLVRPSAGSAFVAGFDVARQAAQVRASIGVTGQYAALDELLTGRENLLLFAQLRGLRQRAAKQRADELIQRFDMGHAADRRVSTYSGGMRRRIDIAVALVVPPRVLFLDEPTTGLDPRSRRTMWDIIRQLVADGVTIFLTTQYLDEADRLADRVAVLDQGHLVAQGTPGELKRQIPGSHVRLRFAGDPDVETAMRLLPGSARDDEDDLTVRVPSDGGAKSVRALLNQLDEQSIEVEDFSVHTPDLDDVFLALTGHASTEENAR